MVMIMIKKTTTTTTRFIIMTITVNSKLIRTRKIMVEIKVLQ